MSVLTVCGGKWRRGVLRAVRGRLALHHAGRVRHRGRRFGIHYLSIYLFIYPLPIYLSINPSLKTRNLTPEIRHPKSGKCITPGVYAIVGAASV